MDRNKAAVIQMVSSDQREDNLLQAAELIGQAVDQGAGLLVLPENFGFMGRREGDRLAVAERPGTGPMQDFLASQASRHGVWIVGGTLPLLGEQETERVYPASLVYNSDGQCVSRYDKIHLFDVSVPETGEDYRESAGFIPGHSPQIVDTPFGRLGLSVCYDLRFPELYRRLVEMGATLLTAPSAFTHGTGQAHWNTLIRARAIENLSYVLAPNQGGEHVSGRRTYGHSAIIDPWGTTLVQLDEGPGVGLAEIDAARLHEIRRNFPCLSHRRL